MPRQGPATLIVDDSAPVRALMSLMLRKRWNFNVTEACCAEEAIELFRQDPEAYDFILLDYVLEDSSGVALLKRLRLIRSDCCVALVTGSPELARAALQAENLEAAVLAKPFTLAALTEFVEDLRRKLCSMPGALT